MNLSKIIRGSKKPNDLVDAVYQAKEKSLKETTRQDSYTKFFRTPQEKRERKLQKINKKFQYYFEHSNQNPNVEFFKKKKKKKKIKKKNKLPNKRKKTTLTLFLITFEK